MDNSHNSSNNLSIADTVQAILAIIEQEREREIITRRYGLNDRKETLEQIGEMLGITRERVRQIEKGVMNQLKRLVQQGDLEHVTNIERLLIRDLSENGRISRVRHVTERLVNEKHKHTDRSHIAFLSELAPRITVINENDNYHHVIAIGEHGTEKEIKSNIDTIVKTVKKHGEPLHIEKLHGMLDHEHPNHVKGFADASKTLAHLNDHWGLAKWPTVNPRNIRDKIYVILAESGKPMHYSDIAESIRESNFKRNDVTTQAIHNELIKDKRFVLIGRGIYALNHWGYSRGTVTDIITDVLKEAGEPLHRDDIVKRVLKKRQVKETTVLLNLQSKPQFKRVAKATYTLENSEK